MVSFFSLVMEYTMNLIIVLVEHMYDPLTLFWFIMGYHIREVISTAWFSRYQRTCTLSEDDVEYTMADESALPPRRCSSGAAGYDLSSCESLVIRPRERKLVRTGISLALKPGTFGKIESRSSLAAKSSIDVGAGVIDSDYRGQVHVLLINEGFSEFKGDRIAQMIIHEFVAPRMVLTDKLNTTERKDGGFGSTGTATIVTTNKSD